MTKILVTGVNGLIAKPLIDALIQNEEKVLFNGNERQIILLHLRW